MNCWRSFEVIPVIINGSSNRCVWWWTRHLECEDNDRVGIADSYGLRSENIHDMLCEMKAMATGTDCQNFFYQINMNPSPGEVLTQKEWDQARQIAEKKHGLEGQPYFMVMHVKYGREHPHFIYLRVDLETGKTISDSHDARTNHAIAREIEREFGLQKVISPYDREAGAPRPPRAPKPYEMYRDKQHGLDTRDITAEVTELFQQSHSGLEFKAGLESHGYELVTGRRGLLILDTVGNEHSLARRCGITMKEIETFMRDVDRQVLPTVEQGKAMHHERKIAALESDRRHDTSELDAFLAAELLERMQRDPASFEKWQQHITPKIAAEMQTLIAQEERQRDEDRKRALQEIDQTLAEALDGHQKKYPNHYRSHYAPHVTPGIAAEVEKLREAEAEREYARHDPLHQDMAWEDTLAKAAIEKEKTEGRFIAPEDSEKHGAGQQPKAPPPAPQPRQQQAAMPENLRGAGAQIWTALHRSDNAKAFASALDHDRVALAAVTEEEANRSHVAAAYPKAIGRFAPEFRAGEIVAVTEQGQVYQCNRRNTGMQRKEMEAFLAPLDRSRLQGIDATKESQHQRLCERHWPIMPPQPETTKTAPGLHIQDAGRAAAQPEKAPAVPANLKGTPAQIWTAYNIRIHMQERERLDPSGKVEKYQAPIQVKGGRDPYQFNQALEEKNMALARVTKDEAERSQKEAAHWKTHGERRPSYEEGEFVVITRRGDVYQLNRRTTGQDIKQVQSFLEKADWKGLTGIEGTKQIMQSRADERAQQRLTIRDQISADRMDRATWIKDWAPTRGSKNPKATRIVEAAPSLVLGAAGKGLEIVANALESLLAPKLTPQQKHEAEVSRLGRQSDADATIDFSRYTADRAQQRQNHQEQQAARDRQRELGRER